MTVIKEQLSAAFQVTVAIAEAIRELKQVQSGILYARLMDNMTRMDLETFTAMIQTLKDTGLVTEDNYMLVWKGPP